MIAERERRVRHLRIACRREEHARRARVLLEDALRTASLDDDGRLIVVRRLDLGALPLTASATMWSRRVEQRFQQLRGEAISVEHPRAQSANVVFFRNAAEPWRQLAERAASAQPCPEWFWPRAARGWHLQLTAAETLCLAFRSLALQSQAAALTLVQRLATSGDVRALLEALREEDVLLVMPQFAAGLAPDDTVPEVEGGTHLQPALVSTLPVTSLQLLASLPPRDVRSLLLAAAAFSSAGIPIPNPPQLVAMIDALRSQPIAAVESRDPLHSKQSAPATRHGRKTPPASADEKQIASRQLEDQSKTAEWDRLPTAAGGLLFLIRLFELAGLPEVLDRRRDLSQAGLAWQLFRSALRLSRVDEKDALWSLPDPAGPLPAGMLWRPLLRAHHRCRKFSGLSLRELICRPALASLTETHIDLFFRPADADVRVRRAGLDVNPGWVPWLQRVVTFHYSDDGR
jgi:hypothetical protein